MLNLSKSNSSLIITFNESTITVNSSLNIHLKAKRKFGFCRPLGYINFYNSWHHLEPWLHALLPLFLMMLDRISIPKTIHGFITILPQALLSRRALFVTYSLISNDFAIPSPVKRVRMQIQMEIL